MRVLKTLVLLLLLILAICMQDDFPPAVAVQGLVTVQPAQGDTTGP